MAAYHLGRGTRRDRNGDAPHRCGERAGSSGLCRYDDCRNRYFGRRWVDRLINAFGSPNNCNATEICAWHRNYGRAFTTGTAIGAPDYDRAGCILLWGHNPSTSLLAAARRVFGRRPIGGITVDPIVAEALRMRRFYVRRAFRRTGIGRAIAQALLERTLRSVRVVTLNAAVDNVPFWEALAFVPEARHGHTHIWRRAVPK
jgi:GNAT superfamily N-acetyltransferase